MKGLRFSEYKKQAVALLLLLAVYVPAYPQGVVQGYVFGQSETGDSIPLPGANVIWKNRTVGTATNANGFFNLPLVEHADSLVVSFVGYKSVTLLAAPRGKPVTVIMYQSSHIQEVTVSATHPGTHIDRLNPIQTQVISSGELRKAACCNLSESFETNASVDVAYSDAITGAKQIQLLGLAGIYTQMQYENVPTLRGLASSNGLSYIPGSWMESIQVSKGTASVANGYESITGQINIEYKKPWNEEKMFANLYMNSLGMTEFNANYSIDVSEKVSTMLLADVSNLGNRIDHNHDGFLDHPLATNYNIFNRWKYQGEKLESNIGVQYLEDEKLSGQKGYHSGDEQIDGNPYGVNINTKRLEAFSKIGYIFDRPATSIGWINAFTLHDLQSHFGTSLYNARQNSFYSNLVFITFADNTNHLVKTGFNFNYDRYDEMLNGDVFDRDERVSGAYAEYTYKHTEMFTLMAGFRIDHHNRFGFFFTPRLHIMYRPWQQLTVRASIGKGYRSPSVISENSQLLTSNRQWIFEESPKLEEAWNYGMNVTQNYKLVGQNLVINLQYYHTNFINQLIVDTDRDAAAVHIYNLKGKSYSNSYQLEVNTQLLKGLDVTLAYRVNDVKATVNGDFRRKPFVSRYKGLATLSYKTPLRKWQLDYTLQLNGGGRLPDNSTYPVDIHTREEFPSYITMNFQLTKLFRKWDLYAGVENLTGYTQHNPIIFASDPYNQYFDASQVWGPLTGAKFYAGARIAVWK